VRRHRVGVSPPVELASRERLFGALAAVLPVEFVSDASAIDAAIRFDGREAGVPCLSFRPQRSGGGPATVSFGTSTVLDARLRGRTLEDAQAGGVEAAAEGEVLAACGRTPVWTVNDGVQSVSLAPPEPAAGERLRDLLRPGRFLSLLPLLHFLREVTAESAWTPPPLRACFLFDDPNLHRPTYGYVRFAELAHDAAVHGYHAAMATIPLDTVFASRDAVRVFRNAPERLSLLVHGNDHVKRELGRLDDDAGAEAVVAQALRRVRRFERRYGVRVSRVMAPPHGACSPTAMRALARLGFDALCMSDAYQGRERPLLSGWEPGELVSGGLPLLSRYHLGQPREDLVFRGLLDQPVVLYGHHEDLAHGLGPLHEAADQLRRLGDIAWMSTEEIAATQFSSRREGEILRIRAYSRRLRVTVPEGVEQLVVEVPEGAALEPGGPLPVAPGSTVTIALAGPPALEADAVLPPPRRIAPVARRVLTEGRDRLRPVLRRG
jgi:hypothetical protein